MNLSKAAISSIPGDELITSSWSENIPSASLYCCCMANFSLYSSIAISGSISIADRFVVIGVGTCLISLSNESPNEWAGSVEMISVFLSIRAHHNAVAAEMVVFPTPPFPPINMNVVFDLLNLTKSVIAMYRFSIFYI